MFEMLPIMLLLSLYNYIQIIIYKMPKLQFKMIAKYVLFDIQYLLCNLHCKNTNYDSLNHFPSKH